MWLIAINLCAALIVFHERNSTSLDNLQLADSNFSYHFHLEVDVRKEWEKNADVGFSFWRSIATAVERWKITGDLYCISFQWQPFLTSALFSFTLCKVFLLAILKIVLWTDFMRHERDWTFIFSFYIYIYILTVVLYFVAMSVVTGW